MEAPIAKKVKKELSIHNDIRIDNYYWLNDRENPEVIDYLSKENSYTKSQLKHTTQFQENLFQEIKGRIKEDDSSVPYKSNGYFYYSKFEKGKEYAIHCRKEETLDSDEIVYFDENERAKDQSYYALGGVAISPNNKLLAYSEDFVSRRIYTIRFKSLIGDSKIEDVIENTSGGLVWANDNSTVFYTVKDDTLRSYKIFKHLMGTPQSEDIEVFHEEDSTYSCHVYKSKSKQYIFIGSYSTLTSEIRYIDANDCSGEFKIIQPRTKEVEYSVAHYQDHFYILTNYKAKNFRLMRTQLETPSIENWEEVVANREDVLLEDIDLFKEYLVLGERKSGLTHIRIKSWDGKVDEYIPFNDPAYVAYTTVNRDYDTTKLRYGYTSLTTPASQYEYDMATRSQELLKQQEIIGGYDASEYVSERVFATAKDGTQIPVSLVYKKILKKKEPQPLLLYGYGSYGYSIDPGFSSIRLSLLDRGFVYAIAHIRGGEELGRAWYDNGKMLNKMNTFTDFIQCAEHLIDLGYTSSEHLYAMGGSAGGLLMGAVINLKPTLWNGVIAAVPFVDVVTTMLDETIPLTTGEYDEWGNPNDETYYKYIKAYSPYDNVSHQDYPNLLVTTGLHDSQVQYWEPAKWVAKLREVKSNDKKLLLHTNMDTGHGGASGRFEALKETAMEYAFILDLEEIKE